MVVIDALKVPDVFHYAAVCEDVRLTSDITWSFAGLQRVPCCLSVCGTILWKAYLHMQTQPA